MARFDADQHVIVPKFVKDRLIRIETRMFDFHAETSKRLDGLQLDIAHLSRALGVTMRESHGSEIARDNDQH